MPAHRNNFVASALLFIFCGAIVTCSPSIATAQTPQGVPENSTKKVSEHVYAIEGFPNIAIVVGSRATLVVDTGLGPRNGAVIVREVQKLTKNPTLYLTTTHFHPEHAAGEQAFPPRTVLVRPKAQQEEMEKHGQEFIDLFSSRSDQNRELLKDVKLRPPDMLFDRETELDLGGVTARLFWLGPAHTQGDELIFVEEDKVLISGDIVQNHLVPSMPGEGSSPRNWIAILRQLEPLKPRFVIPDHGTLGDGSLISKELAFLSDLQTMALDQKRQGKSAAEAGPLVAAEMKMKYPEWTGGNIPNIVKLVYAEAQ